MAKIQRLKEDNKAVISNDLKLAFNTITGKRQLYDLLYNYYRGQHPLRYSTERLSKAFSKIGVYFAENWISVIVDAVLDRLSLKGFDVTSGDTHVPTKDANGNTIIIENEDDNILDALWEKYNLGLMADDVHEAATVLGEGYVIAWKEDDIEEGEITDVYYNDPRMCHVFYDPYRPTRKSFAAKMWTDSDRYPCMILYYPDRLEHYKSTSQQSITNTWVSSASTYQPDLEYGEGGIEYHDHNIIPVFHFRSGRVSGKREIGQSELSLQDAINKLFADMMVSSEFTTWAQRVIISQADPGDLKNGAGVNWWIPAGDGKGQSASVQEIGHQDLNNFMDTIDRLSQALAIISRTPKHYLMLTGSVPSGDALLAMEAPLVKKVTKRIEGYDPEWKNLASFLLLLEGRVVESKNISTVWEPVTSLQPLTSAQTTKTEVEAGIPLTTSVRRQGWAKDEVEMLQKDLQEEQVKNSTLAQAELDMLRANDARDNTNPDGSNSDMNNA